MVVVDGAGTGEAGVLVRSVEEERRRNTKGKCSGTFAGCNASRRVATPAGAARRDAELFLSIIYLLRGDAEPATTRMIAEPNLARGGETQKRRYRDAVACAPYVCGFSNSLRISQVGRSNVIR